VTLEVEWVEDADRFEALGDEWDAVLPAESLPFDLHVWYSLWWAAFGEGAELAVCTARRDGELVGAIPLQVRDGALGALANVHSPSFRPLARDDEAMDALIAATMERGGSALQLVAIPGEDPCLARLESGARSRSMSHLLEASYASPTVDTGGEFEAWRVESKRVWGAPLERFRRKMGREFEAEFSIVVVPGELERELDEGFRVEASGWKGQAGTAIASDPRTEAFYRGLAHGFARRDELRLSHIALDGRVAAFDLCLLHRDRLYLLKTGFDEDFRRLAPGLVMRLSIVERCFELGLRSHELLGGESEWKAKFATSKRPHVNLRAYRRNPVGLARYAYRAALRPRLKRVYRRVRSRDQ
jgi:CelD/BcsL family acetyltransferase involved in cellulose biosynthesis